jgi:hypothetical protein
MVDARHRTSTSSASLEDALGDSRPLHIVISRATQVPPQSSSLTASCTQSGRFPATCSVQLFQAKTELPAV